MENEKTVDSGTADVETVWIVQKLDWQYNDNWYELEEDIPLKVFTDRTHAERYAQKLMLQEQDKWAALVAPDDKELTNLTHFFGGFGRMTTLDEAEFVHRLNEGGIPVKPGDYWGVDWIDWSPTQRQLFWGLFDLIQFYEVVEVELLP